MSQPDFSLKYPLLTVEGPNLSDYLVSQGS